MVCPPARGNNPHDQGALTHDQPWYSEIAYYMLEYCEIFRAEVCSGGNKLCYLSLINKEMLCYVMLCNCIHNLRRRHNDVNICRRLRKYDNHDNKGVNLRTHILMIKLTCLFNLINLSVTL